MRAGSRVDVPRKGPPLDDLVNILFNTAFRRYLANVSEWGRELLPGVDLTKLGSLPDAGNRGLKRTGSFPISFPEVVSSDPTKSKILKERVPRGRLSAGCSGKWRRSISTRGFERASTILSEATGRSTRYGNRCSFRGYGGERGNRCGRPRTVLHGKGRPYPFRH